MEDLRLSWSLVNGRLSPSNSACLPATDVALLAGWTVFETMRVVHGRIPLLEEHLSRLQESASAAMVPVPAELREELARLVAVEPDGEHRVRITLSGTGLRILNLEAVPVGRRGAPIRAVRGPHGHDPLMPGSVKHGSRASWMAAVKRSGVDEMLLVDEEGRFTEGTTSGILAVVDGALWTAPHDGRILQSTTVTDLLRVAAAQQVRVVRQGALADGPFDGLYIASATRGLSPVVELDGVALPHGEPVGQAIGAALWV